MATTALPQLVGSESKPVFRRIAAFASVGFVIVTVAAAIYGRGPGPTIVAFIPICATLWAAAEALTAFFLFAQFHVAGKLSLAFVATAYLFTALLTMPYLYAFPGVFSNADPTLGDLQTSVWIWAVWHCTFPLIIGIAHLVDPTLDRRAVPRDSIGPILPLVVAGATAFAVLVSFAIWVSRDRLMVLVIPGGHVTHDYTTYVAPVIVACNIAACAIVSARLRKPTPLQMWVAFALLVSALDGLLDATGPAGYSIAWYVAKLLSLSAASAVLAMLLVEISTSYRRLSDVATIDPLTGLQNRRTLDADIDSIIVRERREHHGLGMLVLDLDKFKHFNDSYGHAVGDDVLRIVAAVLPCCVYRANDVIARYGGEKFVMVLPNTSLPGARIVAERVRSAIAACQIPLPDGSTASITTSIGVAYAPHTVDASTNDLFASADRALYLAKARGRNRVVVAEEALAFPELSSV